jgi:hypothetical protein
MIVGVSVGRAIGCGKLLRTTLKSAKMVSRRYVSNVGEAEFTEFKWMRNLTYCWLRERAVDVVKTSGPLKEMDDVVVIRLRERL